MDQGTLIHARDSADVSGAPPRLHDDYEHRIPDGIQEGRAACSKIGNADIFEPLIAKDAARDSLLDEILSFFGGRPQPMMAQLIESGKLTLDDIRELEKAAAEADRQRKAERTRKSK